MDSSVTYNWTENTDDELKRTLADTIVTINEKYSYHIEFQMTEEGDIILRMLEYGFHHAMKSRNGLDEIDFPEPMTVYLYDRESFPDEYELRIHFGRQGTFSYRVPVYKYLNHSMDELDQRKLIVLLPFQLLKLRRTIERERTEAARLSEMILLLYHHIYDGYEELENEGVSDMAEEALILDIDILEYEIKKLTKANEKLEEKTRQLENQNKKQAGKLKNQEEQMKNQEDNIYQLVKCLSATCSPEEIAAKTNIPAETIVEILHADR